ncbi:hypothetical protein AB0K00_57045, partial [Dactylosporangium sp. NPDC049525]|uniref:hypothetical protein n=1 Tax=Dactylosporangium sp. NPDC049525 TaxID=3154730 RepID=UPI00343C0875
GAKVVVADLQQDLGPKVAQQDRLPDRVMTAPVAPTATVPAQPAAPAPTPAPAPAATPAQPADAGSPKPAAPPPPAETGPAPVGVEGADSGSWQAPGEAVSRPGSGTARNEHWKAARKVLGDEVDGDKIAGDKIVLNLADKPVQVPELSIDLLEPVRFAFVDPQGWGVLSTQFAAKRTIIVRGRTGHGKDAAAIRLLLGDGGPIYYLDPATDVAQLAASITRRTEELGRSEAGIGFLLCQPDQAGKLRGYTFHALEGALTAANARLVITMSADVLPADGELEPYVLDLGDGPVPHRRIVRSHLSWKCNDEEALAKLLASPAVDELIAELEHGDHTCQSAAELAWIISSVRTEEGTVNPALVRELRQKRQDQTFNLWFDSLRGVEERSFAIALAVLDGLPYEDVADAARRLHAKLELTQRLTVSGGAKAELRLARRDLLQIPVNRLLDTLRAAERDESSRYEYGVVPVRVVAYRDESYPSKIVERVWRGFQIQPTLLNWLYELVVAQSDRVRYFAANTLGVLCRYSFDYLWTSSLSRWADSKDSRLREAVAYALREPAADPRLVPSVNMLVAGWYADRDSPRRQATAARAFGVCVGQPDVNAAIDRLGRLATIDDFTIAVGIGNALADLILEDPEGVTPRVCAALVEWFGDKLRTRAAQLAFLILASTLVTWVRPDPDGPEVQWPSLLRLTGDVDEVRRPLQALWRHLFNNTVLYDEANAVFTGWAALAENDTDQLRALLKLFREVLRQPSFDPRVHRNLTKLTKDWVDPRNLIPMPNAHRAMVALLDKLGPEGR